MGLGLPVGSSDFSFLLEVGKPKLIIQGTRDEFGPSSQLQALYDSLAEPKQVHWVEGADHFFAGKLDEVQRALREFLTATMGKPRAA
jgi:alpha/beta superfamily hydrolase